jgi:hypothetical protein
MLLLYRAYRAQVCRSDLGRPKTRQPLKGSGHNRAYCPNGPIRLGVVCESAHQDQTVDPTGMAMGQGLSDSATHRVPHHRDLAKTQLVEHTGHVVGKVIDLESVSCHWRQPMASVVHHDHPVLLGQPGPDPVPLGK